MLQVEARLHDKDAMLASLQQSAQAMQRQQAQDRQELNASNTHSGQLEGQVASLTRWQLPLLCFVPASFQIQTRSTLPGMVDNCIRSNTVHAMMLARDA